MTHETAKRIAIWTGLALALVLMVWGLAKMAVAPTTGDVGSTLSDPVSGSDHVKGSTMAKVTLVEYSDFQCPACAAFEPAIQALEKKYGNQVLFVYRHFPLPQHLNGNLAARASEAAAMQNKFWEMHDKLFATQNEWSTLSKGEALNTFALYASQLELNRDKFVTDVQSNSVEDRIQKDVTSGSKSGVDSTPNFFVNNIKVIGLQTYADLETALVNALNQNK
jgi:protein-disulfide isomerase